MSEFEDSDLGRRLRAAAGGEPDVAGAQHSIGRRVVRARRRRIAAVTGASAVVLVALGLTATLRNSADEHIQTAEPDISSPVDSSATSAAATSTSVSSVASSTTVTTEPGSTTTNAPRSTTTAPGSTTAPTTPAVQPTVPAPTTTSVPGTPDDSTTSTAPPTSPTVSTTLAPAPDQTTPYTSDGGTITVRFSSGQLELLEVVPAAGYTTEVHTNKPDDVEVRFSNGNDELRIRVRVIDGQMVRTE
jgi:hypothetical protein